MIEKNRETVYVAGPMRGIEFYNFPLFDAACSALRRAGFAPVSPADMDRDAGFDALALPATTDWSEIPDGFDFAAAVRRDLRAVAECDSICLLPGWERSRGARAEKAVAEWTGKRICFYQAGEIVGHEDVLAEAMRITSGDRQASYGPPDQDFLRTAAMWSAILGADVSAREVALCMIALKLSRETHQKKRDNAVDIAGYARCLDLCNRAEDERPRQSPRVCACANGRA